jgi:hypothetical protein
MFFGGLQDVINGNGHGRKTLAVACARLNPAVRFSLLEIWLRQSSSRQRVKEWSSVVPCLA